MSEQGEVYVVPVGLTLHCAACGARLEAGARCWIAHDDDSAILCLPCVNLRQQRAMVIGPTEYKPDRPRRAHRRPTDWMAFD